MPSTHRLAAILLAPVTGELRIEHLAQPVNDHGLLYLREDARVDLLIVLGRAGAGRKRAACHEHDPPAEPFDRFALLLVRGNDLIECQATGGCELVGAGAAEEHRAFDASRRLDRTAGQLERALPVKPHSALCRVHRFGHAETERPQVAPVGRSRIPVECGIEPWIRSGERIGDHMRRSERDAIERFPPGCAEIARRAQSECLELAGCGRQLDAHCQLFRRIHVWPTPSVWERRPSVASARTSARTPQAAVPLRLPADST